MTNDNSTLAVFSAFRPTSSGGRVTFQREGDVFLLSNGVLELRGEMCGERLVQSIRAHDRDCGMLDVMVKLHTGEGESQWPAIRSLCGVGFKTAGDVGILDLVGEWWEFKPPWTNTGVAFRASVRLTVRPGQPMFLVEFVRLENSGTKSFRAERFCFNALPPKGMKPVCKSGTSGDRNVSAWDVGNGLAFGMRSEDEVVQRFAFWVDAKSQCPHGDCGFDFPKGLELGPGQSQSHPSSPGAIVFVRKDRG